MLKAQNISKIYESRTRCTALAETSLTLEDVGLVLITGESGSGKTTLLNLLSGLDTPTSGSVTTNYGGAYAAFVFSDGHLLENFTLAENLDFAMSLAGVTGAATRGLMLLYYFFPALLIVAGVAVLLTVMSVALTYRRSSRLSVIDIIYHRK